MKRTVAKILCIILSFVCLTTNLSGQERQVRIGFQASPVFSGIRNKDNLILKNGGNLGLKVGALTDIYFKKNLSFILGLNFGFHEGGEFQYEIGGNYLPDSDLSDPILQTGDKPLPDGVLIRYQLQYLEVPFGLKIRTKEKGNITYYVDAPLFTFSYLTRGRGDIETEDYLFEQENIYKDLVVANVFVGFGAGIEYAISENNSLFGGLAFQRGLFDFTKDNGWRAVPNPDIIPTYLREEEDSRATVGNLILCLGILF